MERINFNPSNRQGKEEFKSSNSLIEPHLVERILVENSDVVDEIWQARHAKLIYLKGIGYYEELAARARKYGKNPKALMATFVNKELK